MFIISVILPFCLYMICLFTFIASLIGTYIFKDYETWLDLSRHNLMWSVIKACLLACGADGQYPTFMLIFVLYVTERMLTNCQIPKSLLAIAVLYYYSAEQTFFSKDLLENYHSIPFNKAYLGFPNFNISITTILVLLNLLGGHIITLFWVGSWSFTRDVLDKKEDPSLDSKKRLEVYKMLSYLMIFYLLSTVASFIMVQHGKQHLHFTELYAPSLVYRSGRCIGLLVVTIGVGVVS